MLYDLKKYVQFIVTCQRYGDERGDLSPDSKLMAEIGNVIRFIYKSVISAFAGVNESGSYEQKGVPAPSEVLQSCVRHFFR